MSTPPSSDALHKAAFLGPKGENADELERLLLEVLRDHVFWRRNFHPRDPRLIDERDKRTEAFDDMSARLRDELSKILAELKRAAPLYSPRQVAHIVSDPSLPAFVGYFAGLLYNQNNVVAEVSSETVREERAYFKALAEIVGYPTFLLETLPRGARHTAGATFAAAARWQTWRRSGSPATSGSTRWPSASSPTRPTRSRRLPTWR
jgi:hypothetical protein